MVRRRRRLRGVITPAKRKRLSHNFLRCTPTCRGFTATSSDFSESTVFMCFEKSMPTWINPCGHGSGTIMIKARSGVWARILFLEFCHQHDNPAPNGGRPTRSMCPCGWLPRAYRHAKVVVITTGFMRARAFAVRARLRSPRRPPGPHE